MHDSRRTFLKHTAALAGLAALPGASALARAAGRREPASRPNILLILADDMGFSDVGCFGAEIRTPNIDRLAAGGLRFNSFYNIARCSPSRASMLTGRYPHRVGMGHLATTRRPHPSYRGELNLDNATIAEALRQSGYRTMMSGKWHLGHRTEQARPWNRGFDRFYGELNYVDEYFRPQHQLWRNGDKTEPSGEDWYSTDAYTDQALGFMNEARRDAQPWFMYMAYNAPHFPLQAFQEDIDRYRGVYDVGWDEHRRRRYERMKELGIIDAGWPLADRTDQAPAWGEVKDKETEALKMAAYAAQIDRMDQNIGRLLADVEKAGELDNTLVLFLSDNGGCAETFIDRHNPEGTPPGGRDCKLAYGPGWANVSNAPFRFFKRWTHEGGISAPLIAHWPGRLANGGGISDQVGHVIDILPTCLDAAGAAYPEHLDGRDIPPADGLSLMPVLDHGRRDGHDILGWEHEGNRAMRRGDWKISWDGRTGDGNWELYNMRTDRSETRDLAESQPEKLAALIGEYDRWAEDNGVLPWSEVRRR